MLRFFPVPVLMSVPTLNPSCATPPLTKATRRGLHAINQARRHQQRWHHGNGQTRHPQYRFSPLRQPNSSCRCYRRRSGGSPDRLRPSSSISMRTSSFSSSSREPRSQRTCCVVVDGVGRAPGGLEPFRRRHAGQDRRWVGNGHH